MLTDRQIIGSFAQTHCFPRAVQYLDNGIINVKGLVSVRILPKTYERTKCLLVPQITDIVPLAEYQTALDKMKSRNAVKIAIKP